MTFKSRSVSKLVSQAFDRAKEMLDEGEDLNTIRDALIEEFKLTPVTATSIATSLLMNQDD